MPVGMARQWTWMRVWRGDGMMGRLLGCAMAMRRKHGGWEEVVGSTRREVRCKRMEVMWNDMTQVARDERGDATGGMVNGGQV
jgi:hypothetical protein